MASALCYVELNIDMNWVGALEGGITGTAVLKALQKTLHKIDGNAPRPFGRSVRRGKKAKIKNGKYYPSKKQLNQAREVVNNVLFFSIPALGERNKAPLWGGIMGAAAGLWAAFGKKQKGGGKRKKKTRQKLYNLFYYTTAGLLAGEAIKHLSPDAKKQPSAKDEWRKAEKQPLASQNKTSLLSTILYIDDVPVGYQIQKTEGKLSFAPPQYSAKECCPPHFSVMPDGDSWLFEPVTLAPDIQQQVIQELRTMDAGKLLD